MKSEEPMVRLVPVTVFMSEEAEGTLLSYVASQIARPEVREVIGALRSHAPQISPQALVGGTLLADAVEHALGRGEESDDV